LGQATDKHNRLCTTIAEGMVLFNQKRFYQQVEISDLNLKEFVKLLKYIIKEVSNGLHI